MKRKISNQFLANYFLIFVISVILLICAFLMMSFANNVLQMTLKKNNYTAQGLMQDDYKKIEYAPIVKDGGGAQVIDQQGSIVLSEGINTFEKNHLSMSELTDFFTESQRVGMPYSYNIAFNEKERLWLIITFPTSVRIDVAIAQNTEYPSKDSEGVTTAIVAVILFYFLLLIGVTLIYSKISSLSIITPLQKLCESVRLFRDGHYSTRVDLKLKNEFKEIQDTFNDMAERVEKETALRQQSESNRKKLILDISHDLKTPLASMLGYAELLLNDQRISAQQQHIFLQTIYNNSVRANDLIVDMFELSKLDSPDFCLKLTYVDICEFLRQQIGEIVPQLDQAGYKYDFNIPEKEVFVKIDVYHMQRVLHNLVSNTLRYTPKGTQINIALSEQSEYVDIMYMDNGGGIPNELIESIFNPFVRADAARGTGGTGLGLAIVHKIVTAHGGSIGLSAKECKGSCFVITLKI